MHENGGNKKFCNLSNCLRHGSSSKEFHTVEVWKFRFTETRHCKDFLFMD